MNQSKSMLYILIISMLSLSNCQYVYKRHASYIDEAHSSAKEHADIETSFIRQLIALYVIDRLGYSKV